MNVIVIGLKKFTGPASWDEITPKQFLQFLNWQIRFGGDPSGRFALLQLWYGIRYTTFRLLDDEQRLDVLALLDFLDTLPERWLLPSLKLRARAYIGPGDGLDFLTFGEFMYAQAARDRYRETGTANYLADLAAALYRPKARFWQKSGEARRSLFDARTHAEQANRMAELPASVQQGILLNFEGCLAEFPAQFTHLFTRNPGGSEGGSWLDVGLSLARQTGALGTFADLEKTELFLVLTTLDALMNENAELKAKLENG
ncbi:hypothetical protein [Spirosoma areae]